MAKLILHTPFAVWMDYSATNPGGWHEDKAHGTADLSRRSDAGGRVES
ncbi:hypothetical protein FHS27_004297 [Rhodopirellula rubra]|uniref:Uncharacterized protein n=1 Tax=Aporhodopirellula rubra TaxID=980271 RepID=A0A7W5E2M4_9BACT|nr:hypothetical protein [Aporhodopirellula rubra]MBB3208468.1 hypothetical protein [Aporhodopirellula rubra]